MRWYRIGSVILIVTSLFHLFGHIMGIAPSNETERRLLELMTGYVMPGVDRTMMELWNGFSLFYALFFLMTGTLNLMLAQAYSGHPEGLKAAAGVNAVGLGIGTAVSVVHFFLPPIVCISAALFFFILAYFSLRAVPAAP